MEEKKQRILLRVKDLQTLLGVGRETAYALMRSKSFPSIKIGGSYFVSREALDRWLVSYERKDFAL